MKINPYVAVGITVGILAGIWTAASVTFGLVTWVAFLSWASFYALGGKRNGFLKTIPSNLVGVFWGWVILLATTAMGGGAIAIAIAVTVGAFIMCAEANWKVLSFIPGAFIGTAAFFGTNANWVQSVVALVAGGLLAWLSEWTAGHLMKFGSSNARQESSETAVKVDAARSAAGSR